MQFLILWCEVQAAQQRLRNTFRESSKPNKELLLNSPIKVRSSASPELQEKIVNGAMEEANGRSFEELSQERDNLVVDVLSDP